MYNLSHMTDLWLSEVTDHVSLYYVSQKITNHSWQRAEHC